MAKSAPFHFVSDTCEGEKCRICGEDATHKLGEEMPPDDPSNHPDPITNALELAAISRGSTVIRHNLTAYVCCEHFRMIVGPAAPCEDPEKPPYEDGFICGTGLDDPENASWTHEVYETREAAIVAGNEDVTWREQDQGFQTASIRSEKTFMPNPLSAEGACDCAENSEMGEAMMEQWQDKVFGQNGRLIDELQATLDKVWSDFEEKHKLWAWGYWFDDVQEHEFARDEADSPVECTDMSPTSGSHAGHGCRFDDLPPVTKNAAGHLVVASPGVNDKIDALANGFVPWGDRPARTNGDETCDMWTGPCACGATHTDGV